MRLECSEISYVWYADTEQENGRRIIQLLMLVDILLAILRITVDAYRHDSIPIIQSGVARHQGLCLVARAYPLMPMQFVWIPSLKCLWVHLLWKVVSRHLCASFRWVHHPPGTDFIFCSRQWRWYTPEQFRWVVLFVRILSSMTEIYP